MRNLGHYLQAWLAMLAVAVGNGVLREVAYGPLTDDRTAQQLSTLSAIALLGLVMWFFLRRRPPASGGAALGIGLLWMGLTVAFEFLFFHYVGGHSWSALLANYDLAGGQLWALVLLWLLLAPSLFRRWLPAGN
ncbi:MAG: hypothetical protein CVU34_08450 [Betaproteobacteria bacterium HGW-Betaproteobacteria-7]|jgi:hypothetical protein|nr:MAG: hypothetical protein CVU34_08450 [Betaproteobacteria bacterium HGW-Betaproteobacteria-7]